MQPSDFEKNQYTTPPSSAAPPPGPVEMTPPPAPQVPQPTGGFSTPNMPTIQPPEPVPMTASPHPNPLPPMGSLPMNPAQPAGPGVVAGGNKAAPAPQGNPNSTQNALLISEVRDNLVVMNDGTMRAVVACRSINFDLMSDREQEAVEYSYQQFLNSLYFPVQISIRSQRVDIGPYLDRLGKIRRDQDNMLLGMLMDDYINFISVLAQETNIMEKSFFIVIPYYPAGDMTTAVNSSKNFLSNLFAPQKQQHIRIDEATFKKAKDELTNRANTVTNGLLQMGIRCAQLSTKELGQLYYSVYNPDTAVREPLGNFEDLSAPIITKGQGNAPTPHLDKEIM